MDNDGTEPFWTPGLQQPPHTTRVFPDLHGGSVCWAGQNVQDFILSLQLRLGFQREVLQLQQHLQHTQDVLHEGDFLQRQKGANPVQAEHTEGRERGRRGKKSKWGHETE